MDQWKKQDFRRAMLSCAGEANTLRRLGRDDVTGFRYWEQHAARYLAKLGGMMGEW